MDRLKRLIKDEKGGTALFIAVGLGVMLVMAAFAIDYGHLQDTVVKMETAADAGATAGVTRLLSVDPAGQGYKVQINGDIREVVRAVIAANEIPLDEGKTEVVIPDADIKFGKWDFDNNCFASVVEPVPGINPDAIDTCEVTIRKNENYNGRVENFFWSEPTPLTVVSRAYLGWAGKFW